MQLKDAGVNPVLRAVLKQIFSLTRILSMKVIAKTNGTVLVEMTATEFLHITDVDNVNTYLFQGDLAKITIGKEIDVFGLSKHLIQLRSQKPDLKQLRGVMQAFLALTEPEAIEKTLAEAGVPVLLKAETEQQNQPA
jgi:hypothetical protein